MTTIRNGRSATEPLGLGGEEFRPNLYDLAIFVLIAGAFVVLAHGAREMTAPAARLVAEPITLDPAQVPLSWFVTPIAIPATTWAMSIVSIIVQSKKNFSGRPTAIL